MLDIKKFANVMTYIANEIGCIKEYSWGADFCKSDAIATLERGQESLKEMIDFTQLTEEEAFLLGFKKWNKESDIFLVPIYLYRCLPEGMELISIFGETAIVGASEIDTDVRGGCLAYGIKLR